MQGQGVTNYAVDKPSYGFTGSTTEFDDALIQRGIVSKEQALLAKGASLDTVKTLLKQHDDMKNTESITYEIDQQEKEPCESESDDDSFLNDEFMDRYRQQRMQELSDTKRRHFGDVVPISRQDWTREVNDDSHDAWVVVCLTSSDTERTGCIEQAVKSLARDCPTTKFILIPYQQAIANWPHSSLPSLFLYRDGKLQKELVKLKHTMKRDEVEDLLQEEGVFAV
jgi:hypothetical protein